MAPSLECGPCREWGEWVPITTDPNFPVDDYIYFTPEDPGGPGIDEPNCRWWYVRDGNDIDLPITWFTLYGRHGWIIFPTTTHGLVNGTTYPLHCDIVNNNGQHHYQNWSIIVP